MGAGKSMHFESAVLDKYTTREYYLSRGAYGIVYGPIPLHDKQLAIKEVSFADGKVTGEFRERLEEKKVIWTSLEHKNLMRIHQVDLIRLPKVMFLVMDFAAGGSLHKTLRSLRLGNKLPISVVTNWAMQIAEGMLYLHEKNIVHRDLKSSNILLLERCIPYTMMTLKITDFDDIKEHDHTATMSLVGTLAYMAPEVLQGQRFSKSSDVWSFGVVIWEMLSGYIPHQELEPNAIIFKSINGELDNLPLEPSFPGNFKLLLNRCWDSKHTERIPFHDISSILQRTDLSEKYKSDPVLIETIQTKANEEKEKSIEGMTILDKELFVLIEESSKIEVYDSINLSLSRRFNVKELHDPLDIASCSINKCLYIFDRQHIEESSKILRVDATGKLLNKWSTVGDHVYGLSVTAESNVIFTFNRKLSLRSYQAGLNEYSPDGKLISEIDLSGAGIYEAWHAKKLADGHFVVSHSLLTGLHGVCVLDADGKLLKSFVRNCGSEGEEMYLLVYLSVDRNGFVFVVDQTNDRVLLFDSNLEFGREILKKGKHRLKSPHRILLDESTSRVFVAEWGCYGLIKIFQF